jgi:hypothetical protein
LTVLLAGLLYAFPAFGQCTDCDDDGHEWPADCNDNASYTYPGADEVCDGQDNNCDTVIDEGWDLNGDTVPECIQLLTDVNLTGRVDGFDLASFSRFFLSGDIAHDFDGSGAVDGSDHTLLSQAFGLTAGDDRIIDPTGDYSITAVAHIGGESFLDSYVGQLHLNHETGELWHEFISIGGSCDDTHVIPIGTVSGTNAFLYDVYLGASLPSFMMASTSWDTTSLLSIRRGADYGGDYDVLAVETWQRCTDCWPCGVSNFPPPDIQLVVSTPGTSTAGDSIGLRANVTLDGQPVPGIEVAFTAHPAAPIVPNPILTVSGVADVVLSTSATETEYIVWAGVGEFYDFVIIELSPQGHRLHLEMLTADPSIGDAVHLRATVTDDGLPLQGVEVTFDATSGSGMVAFQPNPVVTSIVGVADTVMYTYPNTASQVTVVATTPMAMDRFTIFLNPAP